MGVERRETSGEQLREIARINQEVEQEYQKAKDEDMLE
jgi:hypothetical protein